jgi:hypothetical protein
MGKRRRDGFLEHLELDLPTLGDANPALVRFTLGALLVFGALNAFGGGYYGMSGAEGVPTAWLEGSPFVDYFIPSLVLFTVVGTSFLLAAVAVLARLRFARLAALAAGAIVLGWIAVQVAIIGYVSWMQPATVIAGLLVLTLAVMLPAPSEHGGRPRAPEERS